MLFYFISWKLQNLEQGKQTTKIKKKPLQKHKNYMDFIKKYKNISLTSLCRIMTAWLK